MARDNREYLRNSLAAGAVILWYLLYTAFDVGIVFFRIEAVLGADEMVGTLAPAVLAAVIAIGVFVFARKNEKIDKYGTEVVIEMRKVTWPAQNEVNGATIVVSIMTIIVSIILFAMDKSLDSIMSYALS